MPGPGDRQSVIATRTRPARYRKYDAKDTKTWRYESLRTAATTIKRGA
jgi:hypothetical protein